MGGIFRVATKMIFWYKYSIVQAYRKETSAMIATEQSPADGAICKELALLDENFGGGQSYIVTVEPIVDGSERGCLVALVRSDDTRLSSGFVAEDLVTAVQFARLVKTRTRLGQFDNEGLYQEVPAGVPSLDVIKQSVDCLIKNNIT